MKIAKSSATKKSSSGPRKNTKSPAKKTKPRKSPNPNRKYAGIPLLSCLIRDGAPFAQIKKLVEMGARVSSADGSNYRPLHYAASAGDVPEVVEFLLEKGANVFAKDTVGNTALYQAILNRADEKTMRILQEAEEKTRSSSKID